MFFPNPLPEVIFRGPCADLGPKVRFLMDFGSLLGSKMAPWSAIFGHKGAKRRTPPTGPDPPGPDLGAIWRRKRSKDAFSSIWDRFLVDFGTICYDFLWIVNVTFQNSDAVLP